jgi:hypothetical protein
LKVAASNGEVGGGGEFFARPWTEKGAIVANAQPQSAQGGAGCPPANLIEQRKLALAAFGSEMGLIDSHLMRIG